MLVNITGGQDMTLFEVDAAAQRITQVRKRKILSHTVMIHIIRRLRIRWPI